MPLGWRWAAFGMVLFGHWLASVRASISYFCNQIVERYEKIIAIMLNQGNLKWSVLISELLSIRFGTNSFVILECFEIYMQVLEWIYCTWIEICHH